MRAFGGCQSERGSQLLSVLTQLTLSVGKDVIADFGTTIWSEVETPRGLECSGKVILCESCFLGLIWRCFGPALARQGELLGENTSNCNSCQFVLQIIIHWCRCCTQCIRNVKFLKNFTVRYSLTNKNENVVYNISKQKNIHEFL